MAKQYMEKKFKPWRKGKSAKAKPNRSLKNQLRSKERFLSKLVSSNKKGQTNSNDGEKNGDNSNSQQKEKTEELIKIVTLEIENLSQGIKVKESIEREKKIANKYHQIKFVERQRLFRMERKVQKQIQEAKQAADFDLVSKLNQKLESICMNQAYVAFYPNNVKYYALFAAITTTTTTTTTTDATETVDEEKRHVVDIKKKILSQLKDKTISDAMIQKKSWVNIQVLTMKNYDLALADDNDDDRNEMNDESMNQRNQPSQKKRNLVNQSSDIIGKKQKTPMKKKEEESNSPSDDDDNSGSSDDDDNDEKVDKMNNISSIEKIDQSVTGKDSKHDDDDENSSSSSSSSSDDSSSDDSSSDDSSDSDENDKSNHSKSNQVVNDNKQRQDNDDESDDDFLVDDVNNEETANDYDGVKQIFVKAKKEGVSAQDMPNEKRRGDKSKGWKSQKLRPGEWKKGNRNQSKFI